LKPPGRVWSSGRCSVLCVRQLILKISRRLSLKVTRGSLSGAARPPPCARPARRRRRWPGSGSRGTAASPSAPSAPPGGAAGRALSLASPRRSCRTSYSGNAASSDYGCQCSLVPAVPCQDRPGSGKIRYAGPCGVRSWPCEQDTASFSMPHATRSCHDRPSSTL